MRLPSSEDTISKLFKSQWQKIFFYGGQVTYLEWTKREGPSIPRAHVRTHGLTAPQTVFPTKLAITSCHILSWLPTVRIVSAVSAILSPLPTSNEVSGPPRVHSRCLRGPLHLFPRQFPPPSRKWRFCISVNTLHAIHHEEGSDVF